MKKDGIYQKVFGSMEKSDRKLACKYVLNDMMNTECDNDFENVLIVITGVWQVARKS